jgi:hypothetical protein
VNKLLNTALRNLASDGLIPDPLLDLDDLMALSVLADRVTGRKRSSEYDHAVRAETSIGGVAFRRLSIGAEGFVEACPDLWFGDNVRMLNLAYAFCLAYSAEPSTLWRYEHDRDGFAKAVRTWARGIGCPYDELTARLRAWLRPETATEPDGGQPREAGESDLGWLVEMLCSEYGQTPRYWIWEASAAEVGLCWRNWRRRKEAERRKLGGAADPNDEAIEDLYAYRKAESALIAKLKARKEPHGSA